MWNKQMETETPAWYCARTKPKHERLSAEHLRKNLSLEVFHPRLRVERVTRRGVMRMLEPLFPGYVFVRCVLGDCLNDIQYANGIQCLVHFGDRIPPVADSIIQELRECFAAEEPLTLPDAIAPGDEIDIGEGSFAGMRATVLRLMPARNRVEVLLDILGRPTPVEVSRCAVVPVRHNLARLAPTLAA
jgi:transcriptional antiterminator RfaH